MQDKSKEIIVEEVTEILSQIKEFYNIDDDRFIRGYIFARGILDGLTVNSSYSEAFEVTMSKAKGLSSQLYRTKWIQSIISELEVDVEVRDRDYIQEAKETLSAVMAESKDPKELVAAARAMGSIIKDTKRPDRQEDKANGSKLEEVLAYLKEASNKGQLISSETGVIDVVEIHE